MCSAQLRLGCAVERCQVYRASDGDAMAKLAWRLPIPRLLKTDLPRLTLGYLRPLVDGWALSSVSDHHQSPLPDCPVARHADQH